MQGNKNKETIFDDELKELSAYLDLAKLRGLLMLELIDSAERETLRLSVNGIMEAIEEATAIVRAVETVHIAP